MFNPPEGDLKTAGALGAYSMCRDACVLRNISVRSYFVAALPSPRCFGFPSAKSGEQNLWL